MIACISILLSCFLLCATTISAFSNSVLSIRITTTILKTTTSTTKLAESTIVSPFDSTDDDAATTTADKKSEGPLDLTWDNVELVLDEMRHFLIQDGGNVAIQEIDGPVVRLELQGACGTCPSSTQTLKMGLGERKRGWKKESIILFCSAF